MNEYWNEATNDFKNIWLTVLLAFVPQATTDLGSDWELVDAEKDLNHTVDEVAAFVLAANSASEAAEPLNGVSDPDCEFESEDEYVYTPAPTALSVTHSGRTTRISSSYRGHDWMTH
ncbi:hypothetical protein FRC09_008713 [Ceratobasidium sp. 395]|nr:hypothetical protein FRC09_008713 [Ceratobasidium sp. 395]